MSVAATAILIVVSAFLTSVLSGVMGMAGGVILIAVLVLVLPVPSAMILHGILQGVANGSRAWILREHIRWEILPTYFIGVCFVFIFFLYTSIVVDAAIVLIIVGCFPWVSQFLPKGKGLNITNRSTSLLCGVIVTAAQLIAGASGPLLDAFYQRTPLTRHEIVASKALTQTLGHIFKIIYFSIVVVTQDEYKLEGFSLWLIPVAVAASITGTHLGTRLLDRISEERFRQWTNILILAIGAAVSLRGVYLLVQ